eukprot:748309-Hanusia_phi.AAC.8
MSTCSRDRILCDMGNGEKKESGKAQPKYKYSRVGTLQPQVKVLNQGEDIVVSHDQDYREGDLQPAVFSLIKASEFSSSHLELKGSFLNVRFGRRNISSQR